MSQFLHLRSAPSARFMYPGTAMRLFCWGMLGKKNILDPRRRFCWQASEAVAEWRFVRLEKKTFLDPRRGFASRPAMRVLKCSSVRFQKMPMPLFKMRLLPEFRYV